MKCPALEKYNALETKYQAKQKEVERLKRVVASLRLTFPSKPEKLIMTVTKDGKELKIYETRKIPSIAKQRALVRQFMEGTEGK